MALNCADKAYQARNLRYKKSILQDFSFEQIRYGLDDIAETCSDIEWYANDEETLLSAFDGDDDAASEYKLAYADIAYKAETLRDLIQDNDASEYFDDCTVSLLGNRYKLLGYDTYEEDYYSLTSFESGLALNVAEKKFERKTKHEMVAIIRQCMGIILSYADLKMQFDYLDAVFGVAKNDNLQVLKQVKAIEQAYDDADRDEFYEYGKPARRFDALLNGLPQIAFLS